MSTTPAQPAPPAPTPTGAPDRLKETERVQSGPAGDAVRWAAA